MANVPLYEQVADDLRKKIQGGAYPPGSKLPSTAELCRQYEVSETVVRFAMHTLRLEGLVRGHQGRGVFVTQPEEREPRPNG